MTTQQQRRLLDRLEDLRLDRDWSFERLAAEVERVTGIRRAASSYQRMLSARSTHSPRKATSRALARFLAAQRQEAVSR